MLLHVSTLQWRHISIVASRITSHSTDWFVHQISQLDIKININSLHNGPCVMETHRSPLDSLTWRHHECILNMLNILDVFVNRTRERLSLSAFMVHVGSNESNTSNTFDYDMTCFILHISWEVRFITLILFANICSQQRQAGIWTYKVVRCIITCNWNWNT